MSESTEKAPENEQVCTSNAETSDKHKPTVITCETPTSSKSTKETQDSGPQKIMSGSFSTDIPGNAPEVPGNEPSIEDEKSSTVTTNNGNNTAERGTESKPPEVVKVKEENSLHQLSDLASQKLENFTPSVQTSTAAAHDNDKRSSDTPDVPLSNGDQGGTSNASEAETQKVKTEKRSTKPKKNKAHLRKGKWTPEEEEYTMRIIQHFRTGLLSLPDGHTLRSYLAEKLNCDPMRITKKFSGASCLGKRVYNLCDRSQVSARDLELAKIEVINLERRFRLRIEHGSSLPVSTHFSERLRNTRSELDHANFMRASYLFVNHPSQDINNNGGGPDFNLQVPPPVAPPNAYGSPNFSLAFLQSLANNGQRSAPPPYQTPNNLHNCLQQFQNPLQGHRHTSQSLRNGTTSFYDVRQQQQQSQMNSNLFSALINSQNTAGIGASKTNSGNAQQLSALDVLKQSQHPELASVLAQSQIALNEQQNDRMGGHGLQQGQAGLLGGAGANVSPMEALAARYSTAALSSKQQQEEMQHGQQIMQQAGSGNVETSSSSMQTKKVRTKEEQAEGRMLLGFLQELQNNHQKAKLSSSTHSSTQESLNQVPQLQSATESSDGTLTTRGSSNSAQNNFGTSNQKDSILKRGFDISVNQGNNAGGSSTVSSFYESVPNNEALSGSSGGSSGGNESSGDDKDDPEKDTRAAGPLRKRFRRSASQSLEDDLDSQD